MRRKGEPSFMAYALSVGRLVACPFCREIFAADEASECPVHGLALVPMEQLPPSHDVQVEMAAQRAALPPEHRPLPLTFWRRGRGALLAVSVLGLATFFAPWVQMIKPETLNLSGYALARQFGPWFWGGAVAWFVLIPLIFTRRTIAKLYGVRIISGMFAAMTGIEVAMLAIIGPRSGGGLVPFEIHFQWGLWASALCSIAGVYLATRLGGPLDDLRDLPVEGETDAKPDGSKASSTKPKRAKSPPVVSEETAKGKVVH